MPSRTSIPKDEKSTTVRPKSSAPKATPVDTQIAESLTGIYQTIGGLAVTFGQLRNDVGLARSGMAMVERAEVLTQEWLDLGKQNPAVHRALEKLTQGAGVGGLVILHLAILSPFMASRGIVPEQAAAMALLMTSKDANSDVASALFSATGNGNGGDPSGN